MRLTVMWRSALPVKQATVRQRAGRDAPLSTDDRQFIAQSEPQYVVSVSGLPRRFERLAQNRAVLTETVLKRKNKDPISPDDMGTAVDGESVMVVFVFPKTDAIALDDQEVEFITKLGETEVKKKFKLKDLVFAGQLAL